MLKRLMLFIILNFLIFSVVGVLFTCICSFCSITSNSLLSLFVFCSLFGFTGAFINLLLSRWLAKKLFKMKMISSQSASFEEKKLLDKLVRLSKKAGLEICPQVAIFSSESPNAFATGPSKKKALVAVSSSLLNHLPDDQIDAVLAHELGHIVNGDMVTMTLLQGLINTFTLFLSRILTSIILKALNSNRNRSGQNSNFFLYFMIRSLLDTIFMFFGAILIAAYSRYREFKADAYSAKLTSPLQMIAALKSLENLTHTSSMNKEHERLAAFMIHSNRGVLHLLRSHPPLEKRIEKLSLIEKATRKLDPLNI